MKLWIQSSAALLAILQYVLRPLPVAAAAAVEEALGTIEPPAGTALYQEKSGQEIGIIFFISVMIKVFTIGVGVYAAFNIILAAFFFFNFSGDANGTQKARDQFLQSIIGLLIIALSYTLTGIVSLVFFGDPAFILNPTIQ